MIRPVDTPWSAQLERWALRTGAFALPLVISWNTFDQFVLPKLMVARLLVVLLAGLYVGRLLYEPRLTWKRTPLDLPVLAFIGSAAVSTIFAVNVTTALFGTYSRYEGFLTIATYAGLFWLTVQLLKEERDAVGLIRVMLASAYVVSILTVLQSVFGTPGTTNPPGLCLTRPYATFGHPVPLATFLAMLLPVAFNEVSGAGSLTNRILALNLSIVMGIALLLTLSRGAWVGAALGMAIVFLGRGPSRRLILIVATVAALSLGVGLILARTAPASAVALNPCLARVASLSEPAEGSAGIRLHLWGDTLRLIASRPLLGYGPDTFGLVYPKFQTGDWEPGHLFDKAHSDLLQVAATQGLVGVAVDIWLLAAFLRAFWTGKRRGVGVGMLGSWLAYQVATQVGFSWLPSAAPFWIFAGAAVSIWTADRTAAGIPFPGRSWPALVPAAAILAIGVVVVVGLVRSYVADVEFFKALNADARSERDTAMAAAHLARQLAPEQWVYAVEEGNLDLDLDANGVPGVRADWQHARAAYEDAVHLGTSNPAAFRDLALVDHRLGLQQEAEIAARRAVELNRFDPANEAVLRFVMTAPS